MPFGGGKCAICGANQGALDPAIGLPRCKGEHKHAMYYHVPVPKKLPFENTAPLEQEYKTADRPQTKRNPSWTY
jgi:hypothetical protein